MVFLVANSNSRISDGLALIHVTIQHVHIVTTPCMSVTLFHFMLVYLHTLNGFLLKYRKIFRNYRIFWPCSFRNTQNFVKPLRVEIFVQCPIIPPTPWPPSPSSTLPSTGAAPTPSTSLRELRGKLS